MTKKFLLTTFSGLPTSLAFFCADVGLLTLASDLIENGQSVKIIDFNNSNTLLACLDSNLSSRHHRVLKSLTASDDLDGLVEIRQAIEKVFFDKAKTHILEALEYEIVVGAIDVLGVKPWLGPSLTLFNEVMVALKERHPHLIIAAGGPSINAVGSEILAFIHGADVVSFGDGEGVLPALGQYSQGAVSLATVPNIWYRENGVFIKSGVKRTSKLDGSIKRSLTETVYPGITSEKLSLMILEDSRGCGFGCPFCPHSASSQGRQRQRSPQVVFREMNEVREALGITAFRFSGSSPNPGFLMKLANATKNSAFTMSSFLHPAYHRFIDFQALYRGGFKAFFFGVESTDQDNIDTFLKQKLPLKELRQLADSVSGANIFATISLVVPQIHANYTSLDSFLGSFPFKKGRSSILTSFPTVYPNTPWWNEAEKFQIQITDRAAYFEDYLFKVSRHTGLTIAGRAGNELWSEYVHARDSVRRHGVSMDVNDETALLAISNQIDPHKLNLTVKNLIGSFDFQGLEVMRYDLSNSSATYLAGAV